jgi:hypothetical protein
MKNEFSKKEKEFILRLKENNSKIKIVPVSILIILILGLILDAFNGFYILGNAKSLVLGLAGLILLSILYLIGVEWINSKDEFSHPIRKKGLRLMVLLCFVGIATAACWFLFMRLG